MVHPDNEYYSIQNIFDKLYSESKNGKTFSDLMQYITSENNILLAYRNIKKEKKSIQKKNKTIRIRKRCTRE